MAGVDRYQCNAVEPGGETRITDVKQPRSARALRDDGINLEIGQVSRRRLPRAKETVSLLLILGSIFGYPSPSKEEKKIPNFE